MTFPHSNDSKDWQTAYTRNQAYSDSDEYKNKFETLIYIGFFIVLIYVSLYALRFIFARVCNSGIDDWWHDDTSLCMTRFIVLIPGTSPFLSRILISLFSILLCVLFPVMVQNISIRSALRFFSEFYRTPDNIDSSKIINYRLFGIPKLPPPLDLLFQFKYILVDKGDITKKDEWPAWCAKHLGGPIMLIVFDGYALYLERGNRFSRVVGPGEKIPFLEWYETIKYVVDLRPKKREGSFDVWTKDGIHITLKVQVESRIGNPIRDDSSTNLIYSYDPIAVKKAIERYSVRWPKRAEGEPPELFTWEDAVWGQVTGVMPGYISSRTVDDLFMADRSSGQILSSQSMKEIFDKLNNATSVFGVYVTDFQVLKITIPPEVEKLQREYWKVKRQSIVIIRDGEAKALNIRLQAKSRGEAQRDLILAIADGLEKNKNGEYEEALLLSLSRVMDNQSQDPLFKAYFARETLETLEKLQKMLDQR